MITDVPDSILYGVLTITAVVGISFIPFFYGMKTKKLSFFLCGFFPLAIAAWMGFATRPVLSGSYWIKRGESYGKIPESIWLGKTFDEKIASDIIVKKESPEKSSTLMFSRDRQLEVTWGVSTVEQEIKLRQDLHLDKNFRSFVTAIESMLTQAVGRSANLADLKGDPELVGITVYAIKPYNKQIAAISPK